MAIIPGLETWNLLLLLQASQLWMCTEAHYSIPLLSEGTTLVPPFWSGRYLAREDVLMTVAILWFIGFYGAVHWSLCWRSLRVIISGRAFIISPISVIVTWCTPSNISTHHWVGPHKGVSNRAPHWPTPALSRVYVSKSYATNLFHVNWIFSTNNCQDDKWFQKFETFLNESFLFVL